MDPAVVNRRTRPSFAARTSLVGAAFSLLVAASLVSFGTHAQAALHREITFEIEREGVREPVAMLVPAGRHAPGSLGLVVALHGRGEAVRGAARGHRGWIDDYQLEAMFDRIMRGRVESPDVGGMASVVQLAALRRLLRNANPVAVVMPYTPDLIEDAPGSPRLLAYGRWVVERLLPEARRVEPMLTSERTRTAIDGVSLGGMMALDVGLRHPETFGAVGAIQPALRGRVAAYAALAVEASPRAEGRCLRLSSSTRDPFLGVTRELAQAWHAHRLPHELVEYEGPHGYSFNRGPGSMELLRFPMACFRRER